MMPIPVPRWCAELTAHILRRIQDMLEKQKTRQCDCVHSRCIQTLPKLVIGPIKPADPMKPISPAQNTLKTRNW